jgi:hypothetical protein
MGRPSPQGSPARRALLPMTEMKCIDLIFVAVSVGNCCCTIQSVPTTTGSKSSSCVSEESLSPYLESNPSTCDNVPEAPLATEENLEDSDPLPHWYTVEADTAACLMIRNRSNGSHLIYRKRLRDYIIIPEQSFTHIERDSKLWPNVFTHVGLNTRCVDKSLLESGLQGQGSVAVVVVAEGSVLAEPSLSRAAAEKKNGRDTDDQKRTPA